MDAVADINDVSWNIPEKQRHACGFLIEKYASDLDIENLPDVITNDHTEDERNK